MWQGHAWQGVCMVVGECGGMHGREGGVHGGRGRARACRRDGH